MTAGGKIEITLITAAALALVVASGTGRLPLDFAEACGFATGSVCVWLTARGSLWNFPIGIANNIAFAFLFWRARLFADMGLQGVYLVLGLWGWWQWLHGGTARGPLRVSHTGRREWVAMAVVLTAGTAGLHELLIHVRGAAPFWDSLATTLCLCAQYLLCRKRLENWWLWIVADLIYVPLYFSRDLPLTAVLYAGFIFLCVAGLRAWNRELRATPP